MGSIAGLGRSPEEGNGHPLQYSCLENSEDRGYSPWGCKESDATERLHSLTLWVCFCFINKSISILFSNILWHLLFSVWLTSLSMMISRSVHVTFATWFKKKFHPLQMVGLTVILVAHSCPCVIIIFNDYKACDEEWGACGKIGLVSVSRRREDKKN